MGLDDDFERCIPRVCDQVERLADAIQREPVRYQAIHSDAAGGDVIERLGHIPRSRSIAK